MTKKFVPAPTAHLQNLFDAINGGDDVDAASEAQEIAESLLMTLRTWAKVAPMPRQLEERILRVLSKAEGMESDHA